MNNKYDTEINQIISLLQKYTELNTPLYVTNDEVLIYIEGKAVSIKKLVDKEFGIKMSTLIGILEYLVDSNFLRIETRGPGNVRRFITKVNLYVQPNKGQYIFFAREFKNKRTLSLYKKLKQKIEDSLKIKVVMLEDDPKIGNIDSYILNSIKDCFLFIGDLTTKNKKQLNNNVIYEMGMAKGFGKKTLQIISSNMRIFQNSGLPFDINSHTTYEYDLKNLNESVNNIVNLIKKEIIE